LRAAAPLRVAGPSPVSPGALHCAGGHLLVRLLQRLAELAALLLILAFMPWGGPLGPMRVKHAVLAFLAVVGLGKILFDTFYYDRFRP
jgi:hypothetical protein